MSVDHDKDVAADDCPTPVDEPSRCVRCDQLVGGWLYVGEYCQGQTWYPVDPLCKPCRDEMLAIFGSNYFKWRRVQTSEWPPF